MLFDGTLEVSSPSVDPDPRFTGKMTIGNGNYLVTFNRGVLDCVPVASVHHENVGAFASVSIPSSRQVRVSIWNSAGVQVDADFDLIVICP